MATLRRILTLVLAYAALASALVWPAVVAPGAVVPGGPRTDLWNSLWSLWFAADSLSSGRLPWRAELLDHPDGGVLWVADPVGALLATPAVLLLGLPLAYTLLVVGQLAFSGVMAHLMAEDLWRAQDRGPALGLGWIAGVGYATAPVLLSGVHNGTSEAFAGGWAVWAAWAAFRVTHRGGWGRAVELGLALCLASLASWYSAVVAFSFAGFFVLLGTGGGWRRNLGPRLAGLLLGLALVAPVAHAVSTAATSPDNLVGIKNDREVRSVRRSTGPADLVGYFAPGDYRSPDFRELSRYGEGFFHCHYLGFVLLFGAVIGLRRSRFTTPLVLAGLLTALLSLGPVLARFGQAVIIMGDRAIPLPYLLLEGLPGFGSLSLLYRLAQGPALAVALVAALGLGGRRPWLSLAAVAGVILEGLLLSPLGALPDTSPATFAPALQVLVEADDGAVMNYPIVGGRAYLYEQTLHHKPVTGTLNFPNNMASKKVWKTMLDQVDAEPEVFRSKVGAQARRLGVRYLVVHLDPMARPDMHDEAVRAVKKAYDPIGGREGIGSGGSSEDTSVRVYALW